MTPEEIVGRLRAVDVCTVSDALDRLGRPGAVGGILPVWAGGRVAGRVVTMSLDAADGQRAATHLGAAAIEAAAPGDVIVVERRDDPPVAASSWGGLLARAAVLRGIGGVVIDGPCRDIDEIRQLGLAVVARTALPFTARRRVVEVAVGEPVVIGGVGVAPGDYVIADGSGVAFVAAGDADDVVAAAQEIAGREARMIADLEAGEPPSTVMGRNYEDLLDRR